MTAEDGVTVQGLHKQGVLSESQLRSFFKETSENRASHTLPVGGSVDTSTAVWEIYLHQAEGGDGHGILQSRARLLIVDVPATNPLELGLNILFKLPFRAVALVLTVYIFAWSGRFRGS